MKLWVLCPVPQKQTTIQNRIKRAFQRFSKWEVWLTGERVAQGARWGMTREEWNCNYILRYSQLSLGGHLVRKLEMWANLLPVVSGKERAGSSF